jgi:hypothetical protein
MVTTISELLISLKADTAALLSRMERYFSDWCDDLQVIRTEADYGTFSTSPSSPQLVYLHGSVEHYTDGNLNEECSGCMRG